MWMAAWLPIHISESYIRPFGVYVIFAFYILQCLDILKDVIFSCIKH